MYCPKVAAAYGEPIEIHGRAEELCKRAYREGSPQCEGCELFRGVTKKVGKLNDSGNLKSSKKQMRLF